MLNIQFLCDIGFDGFTPSPEPLFGFFKEVHIDIRYNDVSACFDKSFGGGKPNTGRTSGDQGHFIFKGSIMNVHFSPLCLG